MNNLTVDFFEDTSREAYFVSSDFGTNFFPLIYTPSKKRACHKSTGKKNKAKKMKQGSVTYSTDQKTRLVRYCIYYISEVNRARGKGKLSNLKGHTVKYGPQN